MKENKRCGNENIKAWACLANAQWVRGKSKVKRTGHSQCPCDDEDLKFAPAVNLVREINR